MAAHADMTLEDLNELYSIEQLQSHGTRFIRQTDSCSPLNRHVLNIVSHFSAHLLLLDLSVMISPHQFLFRLPVNVCVLAVLILTNNKITINNNEASKRLAWVFAQSVPDGRGSLQHKIPAEALLTQRLI
jgi:hypothetical protein